MAAHHLVALFLSKHTFLPTQASRSPTIKLTFHNTAQFMGSVNITKTCKIADIGNHETFQNPDEALPLATMESDIYVKSIVAKYALTAGRTPSATAAAEQVYKIIQIWAHSWLLGVSYSGSGAKGTAIAGVADVDLFISLKPETPESLADIYKSLLGYSGLKHLSPRKQNVSVGITYNGHAIDLVPGKKQSGNTTDHSLYRSKAGTWTQTNVAEHINLIQNSQRLDEIRALKIWRALHTLDFPSFYLEMTVINALYGKRSVSVASNVWTVLEYLRDKFVTAAVIDPANSNNKLSDELTVAEKKLIAQKAVSCLKATNWNQILW
jgi:hypothetical protein